MASVALIAACFAFSATGAQASASERDLVAALLLGYDSRVRPVKNWTDVVAVTVQPQIYSLVDVDELREQVTLLLWIPQSWKDDFLVWNTSEWSGISRINVPADTIWTPDGTIFNIVDAKESWPLSRTFARITSDGIVEVDFNKLVDVRCPMDVTSFPFDIQSCELQFGSWGFQRHQLMHVVKAPFVPKNNGNCEWDILSFTARKIQTSYESSMGNSSNEYEEIFYTLVLRRKPLYYVLVLLVPTFLTASVSFVGLFIPHAAGGEREEKVSFGLTTLLTMAVVLGMVTSEMPKSSAGLPLLGRYVLLETVISVAAVMVAVCIMLWHERALIYSLRPPQWMWRMFADDVDREDSEDDVRCRLLHGYAPQIKSGSVAEALAMVAAIAAYCQRLQSDDARRTVWLRFFSFVDRVSMISFLVLNTLLTVYTFRFILF